MLPADFLRLKQDYLTDIKAVVQMEEIPDSLIIGIRQQQKLCCAVLGGVAQKEWRLLPYITRVS